MGTLPAQRPPACAGRFYDGMAEHLSTQVQALLEPDAPRVAARAILCPHAGLMYSGAVAPASASRHRPDSLPKPSPIGRIGGR